MGAILNTVGISILIEMFAQTHEMAVDIFPQTRVGTCTKELSFYRK